VTLIASPLFYWSGPDSFRFPKEILFRAAVILLAMGAVLGFATFVERVRRTWRKRTGRIAMMVAGAVVCWTAIACLGSSNSRLSLAALSWVTALAFFFLNALTIAETYSIAAVWLILIPAAINALVVILQRVGVWNPFVFPADVAQHARVVGLLGNPDYVGIYLVTSILAAAALALVATRAWMRVVAVSTGILLVLGLFATQAFTAIIGCAAGLFCLGVLAARRRRIFIVSGAIAAVALLLAYAPIRTRIQDHLAFARYRQYDLLFAGRLGAFLAAWEMFQHHPISGVGPGCYPYEFLPYRMDVQQKYSAMLRQEPTELNFGETHNDHLQVLAEGGAPGYAIFLAALLFAGSLSFSGIEEPLRTAVDERATFAKLIAFPTTVSLLVLTLGQFPLHLVAPLLNVLFLIAMCSVWSAIDS